MYCDKGMENKAVFLRTEDKIDEQLIQFEGHGVSPASIVFHFLSPSGVNLSRSPWALRIVCLPQPNLLHLHRCQTLEPLPWPPARPIGVRWVGHNGLVFCSFIC